MTPQSVACKGYEFCPLSRLQELGIGTERKRLAEGYDGWYDHERRVVVIDDRLTIAETRSTLAHELVHAERGDRHAGSAWAELQQEHQVDVIAARMLLPLHVLADALVDASTERAVAELLAVEVEVLRARLADLTAAEREYIDARMAGRLSQVG